MIDTTYDVAVIGAGASGISASIYLSRAGKKVALIEKGLYGGVLNDTAEVENYTSYTTVSGPDLAEKMEEHVHEQANVDHLYGEVEYVYKQSPHRIDVGMKDNKIQAKAVVIATGVTYKKLDIPGEYKYQGAGVSQCPTCDGNFFRGKHVAMIGGGDSAVEGALYLSNIVDKVTLIHRRDTLRAEKILQERLLERDNVEYVWDAGVEAFKGDYGKLNRVMYLDKTSGERFSLNVEGAFVNVGITPVTSVFKGLGILNSEGYVKTDKNLATYVDGIFAIGDVRADSIRQIVNATADGATVSKSIIDYLEEV